MKNDRKQAAEIRAYFAEEPVPEPVHRRPFRDLPRPGARPSLKSAASPGSAWRFLPAV